MTDIPKRLNIGDVIYPNTIKRSRRRITTGVLGVHAAFGKNCTLVRRETARGKKY